MREQLNARETQEFWQRVNEFLASTSEPARRELARAAAAELRRKLVHLLDQVVVHPSVDEDALARRYVQRDIFSPAMRQ